jgi:hypothetical protein
MALGVLGNNRTMYNSGVSLFTSTVADYLKWGRGSFATQYGNISRLPGECSETMRDMYHSQFGLGGLLQAAEIAWQQVRWRVIQHVLQLCHMCYVTGWRGSGYWGGGLWAVVDSQAPHGIAQAYSSHAKAFSYVASAATHLRRHPPTGF